MASARSKHSQLVKGGKHVQVATLSWSSTLDVTTLPVGAELSFATYVQHFGRLVTVPSEDGARLMVAAQEGVENEVGHAAAARMPIDDGW